MAKNIERYPVNYEIEYRIAAIASGVLNIDNALKEMEKQLSQPQQKVDFQPTGYQNENPTVTYQNAESTPGATDIQSLSQRAQQFALGSKEMFADTGN